MQKGGLLQNKANPPLFQISFSSVKYCHLFGKRLCGSDMRR